MKKPVDPLEQLRRLRPEREIQAEIMKFCRRIPGLVVWRNNVGSFTMAATRNHARRHAQFGFPGLSDIIGWATIGAECVTCGMGRHIVPPTCCARCSHRSTARFVAIEVKRPGAPLRPAQAAFLDRARLDGALAFRADGIDDVIREFKAAGIDGMPV